MSLRWWDNQDRQVEADLPSDFKRKPIGYKKVLNIIAPTFMSLIFALLTKDTTLFEIIIVYFLTGIHYILYETFIQN